MEPGTKITVTDEGRVYGYFAEWGACILDGTNDCWTAPPSPTDYAVFRQGDVLTAEGEVRPVGVIGNTGGHASPLVTTSAAMAFYQNPNLALAIVDAGEDEHGAWIAGTLTPEATHGDVALIRRSALSGDWRWFQRSPVPGQHRWNPGYDCLGPTIVNRPGLPLARAAGLRALDAYAYMPIGTDHEGHPVYASIPYVPLSTGDAMTPDRQAAITAADDLPLGTDREWDAAAAVERVRAWAGTDEDEPTAEDWTRYGTAFLVRRDDADPATYGAYALPFGDIEDDELKAMPAALRAAASRLPQADITSDEQNRARTILDGYFARMNDDETGAAMTDDEQQQEPEQAAVGDEGEQDSGDRTNERQGDEVSALRDRVGQLEERLGAVEEYLTEWAMTEMESATAPATAALPPPADIAAQLADLDRMAS